MPLPYKTPQAKRGGSDFGGGLCGYCLWAAGSGGAARGAGHPSVNAAGAAGGFARRGWRGASRGGGGGGFARRGRARGNSRAGGGFALFPPALLAPAARPQPHASPPPPPPHSPPPASPAAFSAPRRPRRPRTDGCPAPRAAPPSPAAFTFVSAAFTFVIFVVPFRPCFFIFVIFVVSSCNASALQKSLHYCKCELFSLHLYHSHMTEGRGHQRMECPFSRAPAAVVA